jgi:hypothetical protein
LSFHSYSLHLIGSILTFSFSYSHTASLFLIDVVNSTLLFSFSCCYISLDRHNFPSAAHFLLPCSIIHISHHMDCLISFLPISACFHRSMSIFCPFYAVMILASLFSDKLASSLQTRRRPVRILPLSPSIFTLSCLLHALILSCGGVLYRLHFLQRFSNCSAATVNPSRRHVGFIYVNCSSPVELFHACRHVYALHLFLICGTS